MNKHIFLHSTFFQFLHQVLDIYIYLTHHLLHLASLIQEAFDNKNVGCKVYVDYTDGFSGEVVNKVDIMKQNGSIKSISDIDFSNPEWAFFEKKKIDPHEIDFKGKTVGLGTVIHLPYNAEENKCFGDGKTAFDFAEMIIRQLKGNVRNGISSLVDYDVVSKQMRRGKYNDEIMLAQQYDDYCGSQENYKGYMIESDAKRAKKGKPEIRVIQEDEFYAWLKEIYEELKSINDLSESKYININKKDEEKTDTRIRDEKKSLEREKEKSDKEPRKTKLYGKEGLEALKQRYSNNPFRGSIDELKSNNKDVDFTTLGKHIRNNYKGKTIEEVLKEIGVLG